MDSRTVLKAYLEALGVEETPPDLPFLRRLLRKHVEVFPFASVGPMLGDALPLDVVSLFDRIVTQRRGGYCFEQNALLCAVMEALKIPVKLVLGRVIYNRDTHPGLTHRISLITLGGHRYLVDVGFGSLGPDIPVPMNGAPAAGSIYTYRVHEPSPGSFHLQYLKNGVQFSLYKFEQTQFGEADCELGHFYSHKHPEATFVNHLVVARMMGDETRSLRDRSYRVIGADGTSIDSSITNAAHLHELLTEKLGLRLSESESAALLTRIDEVARPGA